MAGIVRQLFQLQEVDLDIEATERTVRDITARLGESEALRQARSRLAGEQNSLEALLREQRGVETDAEDLTVKIVAVEKDLYGGRIRVPKELAALQQDAALLKTRRTQLEDRVLVIMEEAETCRASIARSSEELRTVEAGWRLSQEQLTRELEQSTQALAGLKKRFEELAGGIDGQSLGLYRSLRKQKGVAVARVEQGICRGCRISLPVTELQLARGGNLVQCSSCGRILYLP